MFDADLGPIPLANRDRLAGALNVGLSNHAVAKATDRSEDPSDAVRVVGDALSIASDMTFIGQASAPPCMNLNRPLDAPTPKNTMPIKFTFDDRNARIHFEKTMKNKCGLKVSPSLPKPIRDMISIKGKTLRESNPDSMYILRTCSQTLSIIVLKKAKNSNDGWRRIESIPIDPSIMVRTAVFGDDGGMADV